MSNKQHLLEILAQLRIHADQKEDGELHQHLNILQDAINEMDAATEDEDGEGGNSPDENPDLP